MTEPPDHYDLNRFASAQSSVIEQAVTEIRNGRKETHWMWFVFPQLLGLGSSPRATRFGIKGIEEARAYLDHPILGPRLLECAQAVLDLNNLLAIEIFGTPDDIKLRSCATLFAHISPKGSVFHQLLDKYYESEPDPLTLAILTGATD